MGKKVGKQEKRTRSSTPPKPNSSINQTVRLFFKDFAPNLRQMDPYKLAQLYDAGGDLKKRWYVYFYVLDEKSNKYIRHREFLSTKIKARPERYLVADELISAINELLLSGKLTSKQPDLTKIELAEIVPGLQKAMDLMELHRDGDLKHYRSAANRFARYCQKNKYTFLVSELNKQICNQYLVSEYGQKSPTTYNNAIAFLSSVFSFAEEFYNLEGNPFKELKRRKQVEGETLPWPIPDLVTYLDHCKSNEKGLYIFSLLIFQSFFRLIDLERLRKLHCRLDENIIILPGSATKNRKTKPVTISNELKQLLIDHTKGLDADGFVFSANFKPGKEAWYTNAVREYFKPIKEKLKLADECTLYRLKHTGNTIADQVLQIDRRKIQQQNRHSSLQQTEGYMSRISHVADVDFVNFPGLDELKKLSSGQNEH